VSDGPVLRLGRHDRVSSTLAGLKRCRISASVASFGQPIASRGSAQYVTGDTAMSFDSMPNFKRAPRGSFFKSASNFFRGRQEQYDNLSTEDKLRVHQNFDTTIGAGAGAAMHQDSTFASQSFDNLKELNDEEIRKLKEQRNKT
jgi:hypothetical protein